MKNDKPKFKYRNNIKDLKDADYLKDLSKEDRAWYEDFENEYYSNALNKEGSIHREILEGKIYTCNECEAKIDAFQRAKKQTFDATNAQNRDSYGISSTGNYLKFIEGEDFYNELISPLKKTIDVIDPQNAFNILLNEVVEELASDTSSRSTETILTEMSIEMVKLGASISKQRAQKILKKRREKKEAKLLNKENK